MPRAAIAFILLLTAASLFAAPQPKLDQMLDGTGTLALTLDAPLQQLFAKKASDDDKVFVRGTLSYTGASGQRVTIPDLEVSVRGHSSRRDTECTFPKLKLKLKGGGAIRLGTHCGEEPGDTPTTKYGRLANEKSPLREAMTYRLLAAMQAPALRARAARVTYVDGTKRLTRNAVLVEDDDEAMARIGGTSEVLMDAFGNVKARHAESDAARIAFAEAAIGNFDWCLKFAPDDIYRCDEPRPLWNILAFDRGAGKTALVIKDLDLAGTVAGTHPWFGDQLNKEFIPNATEAQIEVVSQVQRTRSLFPRATLDAMRRDFTSRKPAAYAVLSDADVDQAGRAIARRYLDAFFAAIGDDIAFYQPIVARSDVRVYRDAARGAEACGPKDVMRQGTPVRVVETSGTMSRVSVLDVMWRWTVKDPCNAIRTGTVWIDSSAITRLYPLQSLQ